MFKRGTFGGKDVWKKLVGVVLVTISTVIVSVVCSYARNLSLLNVVDMALRQSDEALDFQDTIRLTRMDILSAEHRFDSKIIPLTSFGLHKGTGAQTLGLEIRRDTSFGSTLRYGFAGNRIDENGDYLTAYSHNARAYVKISQGLWRRWGRNYNLTELNVAELRARESEISVERAKQRLIRDTVRYYYNLCLAEQLQKDAELALQRSKEHLQAAVSKAALGLVAKTDVYRAELSVLDAESMIQNRLQFTERARNDLKNLLRFEDEDSLTVPDNIVRMVPALDEDWTDNIFRIRPDWQALLVRKEILEKAYERAQKNLLPDVAISFLVEQKGRGNSTDDALQLDKTNWSIQLELLSTFDSFAEKNALVKLQVEQNKSRREEQALRRLILQEGKEAIQELFMEEEQSAIAQKKLHQAVMALDLAKIRYEKGLSDNLEIIDAKNTYLRAEYEAVAALVAYNIAATNLAYTMGVLDREWLELALDRGSLSGTENQIKVTDELFKAAH